MKYIFLGKTFCNNLFLNTSKSHWLSMIPLFSLRVSSWILFVSIRDCPKVRTPTVRSPLLKIIMLRRLHVHITTHARSREISVLTWLSVHFTRESRAIWNLPIRSVLMRLRDLERGLEIRSQITSNWELKISACDQALRRDKTRRDCDCSSEDKMNRDTGVPQLNMESAKRLD